MTATPPTLRTALRRATRRCFPQCGQDAGFQRWLTMPDPCSVGNMHYLPDQDDRGADVVVVARALFILPLIATIVSGTSPDTRIETLLD